jgi:multiple sugar transport system permease protein
MVYMIIVLFVPLAFSLVTSFFKWDLIGDVTKRFIGLKNFKKILTDEEMLNSFLITIRFLFWTVFLEMVFGYLVALFLNRSFRGNHLVRVIVLIPMMLSPTIVALMWKIIFDGDHGLANYLISLVRGPGYDIVWFSKNNALRTVIFVDIWLNTPFVALMVLAGLQSIPKELIEAADVDGASILQKNRYIIIPFLRQVILVAIIFRTTFNLRQFPLPWIMTAGGPAGATNVFGIELYKQAFSFYHIGYSSALSWILILITFIFSVFYTRITLRGDK